MRNAPRSADSHHGPDVVDVRRDDLVQVDLVVEEWAGEQRDGLVGGRRVEHAVEDGRDQRDHQRECRADAGHQNDARHQRQRVRPDVAQQAAEFLHAFTLSCSSTSMARSHEMAWMPA